MNEKFLDLKQGNDFEMLDVPAQIINDGGIVLFPTETVYGIGANGLDDLAVKKIFLAKGRAQDNPLILHISDMDMLESIVDVNNITEYCLRGSMLGMRDMEADIKAALARWIENGHEGFELIRIRDDDLA